MVKKIAAAKPAPEVRSFSLNHARRNAIASAVRSKFSEQVEKAQNDLDRQMGKISQRFAEANCPSEVFAVFDNPSLRPHLSIRRVYCTGGYLHVPERAWNGAKASAVDPYLKAAEKAQLDYQAVKQPIDEAVQSLVAVLMGCSTSKKAIEQLPELKALIEAQSPYQAQTSGGLAVYGAADAAISKLVALGMKLPA